MLQTLNNQPMKDISIIIPAYNEAQNIELLCHKIHDVMAKLDKDYELVFVEGGSRDRSFDILLRLREKFPRLTIVKLRKRCDQSISLSAGIHFSQGDVIIAMDSDLQDNPEDIPRFLEALNNTDIVCGWRKLRQDSSMKIFVSQAGNRVLAFLTGVHVHDSSCTFKSFRREAAEAVSLKLHPGFHRFIPLIATKLGFNIQEIETDHHPRLYGRSKYTFLKVFPALYDYIRIMLSDEQLKEYPRDKLLNSVKSVIS